MRLIYLLLICTMAISAQAQEGRVYILDADVFLDAREPGVSGFVDHSGKPITGRIIHQTGYTKYEYNSVNGLEDGITKAYFKDLIQSESEYKEGQLHGLKKIYLSSGGLSEVIQYSKGKRDGLSTIYNKDGSIQAEYIYRADQMLIGYSGDDLPEISERGQNFPCTFEKDVVFDNKTGLYVLTGRREGVPASCTMHFTEKDGYTETELKKGVIDGTVKVYKNSLLISVTEYKEGTHHGEDSKYYKNGKVELTLNYRHGLLEGLITAYTEEGLVLHDVIFRDGKAISGYITYGDKHNILTQAELADFEEVYKGR